MTRERVERRETREVRREKMNSNRSNLSLLSTSKSPEYKLDYHPRLDRTDHRSDQSFDSQLPAICSTDLPSDKPKVSIFDLPKPCIVHSQEPFEIYRGSELYHKANYTESLLAFNPFRILEAYTASR